MERVPPILPAQGAVALREGFRFQPHLVQHRDEEIAQGSGVSLLAGDVAAMPEAAACQHDRQISWIVGVGVAEIAAEENRTAAKQGVGPFLLRLQLGQETAETVHQGGLDLLELLDLRLVAAVMGQVVMLEGDSVDLGYAVMILDHDGDNP